jgi:hypothetical protein
MIAARSALASRSQLAHINQSTACALTILSAVAGIVPGCGRRAMVRNVFYFCSVSKFDHPGEELGNPCIGIGIGIGIGRRSGVPGAIPVLQP